MNNINDIDKLGENLKFNSSLTELYLYDNYLNDNYNINILNHILNYNITLINISY